MTDDTGGCGNVRRGRGLIAMEHRVALGVGGLAAVVAVAVPVALYRHAKAAITAHLSSAPPACPVCIGIVWRRP